MSTKYIETTFSETVTYDVVDEPRPWNTPVIIATTDTLAEALDIAEEEQTHYEDRLIIKQVHEVLERVVDTKKGSITLRVLSRTTEQVS